MTTVDASQEKSQTQSRKFYFYWCCF